jgi:hypothetical protein
MPDAAAREHDRVTLHISLQQGRVTPWSRTYVFKAREGAIVVDCLDYFVNQILEQEKKCPSREPSE